MATTTELRPFERSSNSANITYYRERGAQPREPYVWASVMHSLPYVRVDGAITVDRSRPDSYHVTVYRNGVGELGTLTHHARRGRGELSARFVAQLVRKVLQGNDDERTT